MDFIITIPEELTAGIVAASLAENKTPEKLVSDYAIALATKVCQDLKVGPFYEGVVYPKFNSEGLPFDVERDSIPGIEPNIAPTSDGIRVSE